MSDAKEYVSVNNISFCALDELLETSMHGGWIFS